MYILCASDLVLILFAALFMLASGKKRKANVLAGESDDDGEPNTYDYNDSFIDDDELSG